MKKIKIIIIGGGFAGLQVIKSLKKYLKNNVELTLIDRKNEYVFIPSLIEYVTGFVTKEQITCDLNKFAIKNNISYIHSEISNIDFLAKLVFCRNNTISFDYLILATGSESKYCKINDKNDSALVLKTFEDAKILKEKLNKLAGLKNSFTVSIIGGGPTGIQLATFIEYYLRKIVKFNPPIVKIIHSRERLLNKMPIKLSSKVENYLSNRNISIVYNEKVKKIEKNKILLTSDNIITSDIILWAGGVCCPEISQKFNLLTSNRGIIVDNYFRSINTPDTYAIGDCMTFSDPSIKSRKLAQTAILQADKLALNLSLNIKNKFGNSYKLKPYIQKELPILISLPEGSILNFKGILIQNKFINLLHKLIRIREKIKCSGLF